MLFMATATPPTALIFPWNDSYSVRIPQIDAQHKGLIRLINDLHSAMAAGKGKEALGTILDELVRYTESHFKYEEGMLRQRQYSGLAAHQSEHQKLTGQVIELRERFRSNRLTLTPGSDAVPEELAGQSHHGTRPAVRRRAENPVPLGADYASVLTDPTRFASKAAMSASWPRM